MLRFEPRPSEDESPPVTTIQRLTCLSVARWLTNGVVAAVVVVKPKVSLIHGPNPASFYLFSFFSHDKYSIIFILNDKSVDGVPTWDLNPGQHAGRGKRIQ